MKPLERRFVLHKVLKSGDKTGRTPDRGVSLRYITPAEIISGKTFGSSRGGVAPAFRLRDLIPGWVIALQHMHPGDNWEVYIPAESIWPSGSTGYTSRIDPYI